MSIIGRTEIHQYEDDIGGSYCLGSEADSPPRGGGGLLSSMENKEKRIRREIANSNERRRMQSINAGFQSLRTLLPHHEGEKLSKAAILQQTAEYIYNLEQEKTTLLAQNCQLKRLIEHDRNEGECTVSKKRKTDSGMVVVESADEGLSEEGGLLVNTAGAEADDSDALTPSKHQELIDIRIQLDRERGLRLLLEEKLRAMQSKCYSDRDRIRDMAQMHVQYETEEDLKSVVLRRETEDSTLEMDDLESNDTTTDSITTPSTHGVAHTETVVASDSLPSLPDPSDSLLLSTHIKQEPIVEGDAGSNVHLDDQSSCNSEDIDSSVSVPDVVTSCVSATVSSAPLPRSKVYIASASRPNLETIVEAIRHLEGDNLFEDGGDTQDAPLALTKHPLSSPSSSAPSTFISHQQFQQQHRPGVIVVKHS